MIRTALISVSDKSKLDVLIPLFIENKTRILSTGNTATALEKLGLTVETVSSFTGYPEILGGRVKSLHPKIYAGILCDLDKAQHRTDLEQIAAPVIDLVICNLYPFQKTVANPDCSLATAVENIDVGGPSMIRAAAKNFKQVAVLVSPDQYQSFVEYKKNSENDKNSANSNYEYHFKLATKAFEHTAEYDQAIQTYFNQQQNNNVQSEQSPEKAKALTTSEASNQAKQSLNFVPTQWNLQPSQNLRYGENPHQSAGLFQIEQIPAVAKLKQIHGKEISYNNILDFEAALNLANDFNSCVSAATAPFWVGIFKHLNPCGIGLSQVSLTEAFNRAFEYDPISPFGGIVIVNQMVDTAFVQALGSLFLEALIAPDFEPSALEQLKTRKNIRLMQRAADSNKSSGGPSLSNLQIRSTHLGLLIQEKDRIKNLAPEFKCVTERKPTKEEESALNFAWLTVKQLRSNAIAFASCNQTIALGMGQTNRVQALQIALQHLQKTYTIGHNGSSKTNPIVCASDAFFPFNDSILSLKNSPISAIIQPGGSIKDEEVIAACNQQGLAMLFTAERHFTH